MKRLTLNPNLRLLSAVGLLLALAGCGDGGISEVRQWMDQVRRDTRTNIPKLPKPKQFTPFVYEGKATIDPYNVGKLNSAFAKSAAASGSSLKPDLDRRREALEGYPLDALRMVGSLEKAGMIYALVQADKTIYQVKVGNYLGQNLGMVTGVSERAIDIKEVVQDAAGEWVERRAKLELQESRK